jgi:coenzyme F420-0:L-glutamate ligase / coenzyme F420-1:gamma-L-glutamate ligase
VTAPAARPRLEVVALPTAHRFAAGDDVVDVLLEAAAGAGVELRAGDVVCVASKVVSKAAGAVVALPAAADVHAARRLLAAREAVRVVAETPWVLVVETRHGFVCANAGIDTSNLDVPAPGDRDVEALLIPAAPSATSVRPSRHGRPNVSVTTTPTSAPVRSVNVRRSASASAWS